MLLGKGGWLWGDRTHSNQNQQTFSWFEAIIVYLKQIYCHNFMSIHVRGLYTSDVKILVHTSVARNLHIIEGRKKK